MRAEEPPTPTEVLESWRQYLDELRVRNDELFGRPPPALRLVDPPAPLEEPPLPQTREELQAWLEWQETVWLPQVLQAAGVKDKRRAALRALDGPEDAA